MSVSCDQCGDSLIQWDDRIVCGPCASDKAKKAAKDATLTSLARLTELSTGLDGSVRITIWQSDEKEYPFCVRMSAGGKKGVTATWLGTHLQSVIESAAGELEERIT